MGDLNYLGLLGQFPDPIPVLDYGFVELLDYLGNDAALVEAARVSYQEGTKTIHDDEGLIRYLLRNHHTSPIEMCEIKVRVKMPILVARQWIRHRAASYSTLNEVSARYSELPNEVYIPKLDRIKQQSTTNKQGSGEGFSEADRMAIQQIMANGSEAAMQAYRECLDRGVAREIARVSMPVNCYTMWVWKIDLHNLLHFLTLRMDEHAQWEIRQFANVMGEIVKAWVPLTWKAFEDYRLNAEHFSAVEAQALASLFTDEQVRGVVLKSGLKAREAREFAAKLRRMLALAQDTAE